MTRNRIIFPEAYKAELVKEQIKAPGENDVLVRTQYSTISPGTERANYTGDPNCSGAAAPSVKFPRGAGYSSAGVVLEIGAKVKSVKPGDRVICYWGVHTDINRVPESRVVKIDYDSIGLREASTLFIATFPMAAIRKTRLEIGESCMVMGLGLLGQFAVRIAKAAGAVPVIACDPVESRRNDALKGGADYALDPMKEGFADEVKRITGKGVNSAIEVTGFGAGLDETLDCMARMGRVALLGCTRSSDFTIDYYRKIHYPGIELIGAHTLARPENESYPGHFTHSDDLRALLKLCAYGRLDVKSMLNEIHSPRECQEVFDRLANDKSFPICVQFDWREDLNV